jgi:hypothetical protein
MTKYIDADKLKAHIEAKMEILWDRLPDADKEHPTDIELRDLGMYMALEGLVDDLDSLQQDKESVELELCSQTWWEERGWIMIPPDATIEGIDSLLKQVRKKLQQEQPEVDLEKEVEEYFQGYWPGMETAEQCNTDLHFTPPSIMRMIEHFFELGQCNARKK